MRNAAQLVDQNEAITQQLSGIQDRDPRKSFALYQWEIVKMQNSMEAQALANVHRMHEFVMQEDNVPTPVIPEVTFNDRKAERHATFGGHFLTYAEIGKAIKASKEWRLLGKTVRHNYDTSNECAFIAIESPSGQRFAVCWDVIAFKDTKRRVVPGSVTPYIYMIVKGKRQRMSIFAGSLGWTARKFMEVFPNANQMSPYFGYRAPHQIALIALLLDGQKLNIVEKQDVKRALRKIAEFSR